MNILSASEAAVKLAALSPKRSYKAMYSSLYGGIVVDPLAMVVPIDDHMVHRGDGVFEALRVTPAKIYLMREHLERLFRSAEKIGLKVPATMSELENICEEVRKVAKLENAILRIFVSRGPGDFSPNPYSTLGSHLYVVATDFKATPKEHYEKGATVMTSHVAVKPTPYAQIKSCNYLPNVMMKKESIDAGVDFSVNFNDKGFLAEGPTENIAIVSADGEFLAPNFDYTLRGTTLVHSMELALELEEGGLLRGIRMTDISLSDVLAAREIMMIGTTFSVLPVVKFDGKAVGNGKPGPIAAALHLLVQKAMY